MEYSLTEYGMSYKKAEDRYNAEDYDGAVENLVDSLSSKPNYKKASSLLEEVAPKAYEEHENKAKEFENRTEWEGAIVEYDALLAIAERVSYLRGNYPEIDTQTYIEKRKGAVLNIAEAYYIKGVSLMNSGKYREATDEFRNCENWVPGYKDAELLCRESRAKALERIAVMPFENRTGKTRFGEIGTLLTDQIIGIALYYDPEFIEFIGKDYLDLLMMEQQPGEVGDIERNPGDKGRLLGVHAFVFGEVRSLIMNYPPETSTAHDRETMIYRREEDGGSYKVTAKCTYCTKKGEVMVTATYRIFSVAEGTVVKTGNAKASAVDEVEWARYKGDERALSPEDQDLCALPEMDPEPEQVLVDRAIEQLGEELATDLLDLFR